jgi:Phage stabilisation protein
MARTNAPQVSTYKSATIKFDGLPAYRNGNPDVERDCQIVNMYYERVSQENKERMVVLKKRPGLALTNIPLNKSVNTDKIRGYFYESANNTFYWAVNNKVYACPPSSVVPRTVVTLSTSSGQVGFCSFLKSDNTAYVVISDGTDMWIDNFVALSCTQVVDADLPSPHEPCPIYLDGYIFVIKKDTGDIYNSDVDDPFAWTAGSFLSTEMSADFTLCLGKTKNYIVCFGKNSIEYFYNAAVETGSPLARYDSPFRNIGYVTGLNQIGDTLYFIGQDAALNISVYMLNSFKIERISTSVVDRTLQTLSAGADTMSPLLLNYNGYTVSIDGHSFYCIPYQRTTWVYDIDEKLWYEWRRADNIYGLEIEAIWTAYNGAVYAVTDNQSFISIFSVNTYQEYGTNFVCQYTTENFNAGTFNWKVLSRLSIESSTHSNTGTSPATISWSDDDWAPGSESTGRDINVFSSSPFISNCGRFRSRSFRIRYSDNYPFFMYSLELDLNVMGI